LLFPSSILNKKTKKLYLWQNISGAFLTVKPRDCHHASTLHNIPEAHEQFFVSNLALKILAQVSLLVLLSTGCDSSRADCGAKPIFVGDWGSPCRTGGDCDQHCNYDTNEFYTEVGCCGGTTNGKYCAQCCVDTDCARIMDASYICVPGNGIDLKYADHVRICVEGKSFDSGKACWRNDLCKSGVCLGAKGQSGDVAKKPFGKCA
jgi:hypothetical protein